uniref:Uncharacterized protein n=1 Tax=uncultured bacterium fosmid pJB16B1 TaxID=1478054 RepID=A0A0H3UA86_9BACT|nr:hypothetical protein [uncultured bacterium fosmid pJB16B1]
MISDLFRKDYRQMTAQGVTFTPEDIVRLNALAVKVKLSQNAAQEINLPRLAFLDDLTLREPTIAHDLWIEEASRWIDCRDDRNFMWLHGYALSRPAEDLVDALKPKKVIKAVYRFAAKRLCRFTRVQLQEAIEYVLVGADWTSGEHGPAKSEPTSGEATSSSLQKYDQPSPTLGLLASCRAIRLPITLDDAKKMTASELEQVRARARILDHKFDPGEAKNDAMGEYVRAREEIRARSSKRGDSLQEGKNHEA